jgi:hypothetical protein
LALVSIELIFLFYNWYTFISFYQLFSAMLFIIGAMFFWLNYNYAPNSYEEAHLKRIYFAAFIIFILIMFKVPMLFFAIVISALSWWILESKYFTFEFTSYDNK